MILIRGRIACIPLARFNWRLSDGIPLLEDCKNFFEYHLSPELATAYQSFWDNENGIQDKFASYWKVLAKQFKDSEYIIGYDIWNEPWTGNLWEDVRAWWPGYSDHYQILPFYRKMDKEIRTVNPNFISMFESAPFPNTMPFFGGKVIGGFTETPAGSQYLDRQAFNMHSYCCAARYDVCAKGEPQLVDALGICVDFHKHKIVKHKQQAADLGIPFIVTEFGACSSSLACYHEMKNVVSAAEESLVSWLYWNYKPYGDFTTTADSKYEGMFLPSGEPQEYKLKALTVTYIQSYQGDPIISKFNPVDVSYVSKFVYDPKVEEASVLYLHKEVFYANGFVVVISDDVGKNVECEKEEEGNYIYFKIARSERFNVTVSVTKK